MLRDLLQEVKELGVEGTAFRIGWEVRTRTGLAGLAQPPPAQTFPTPPNEWLPRLPFSDPLAVAYMMRDRIPEDRKRFLQHTAQEAAHGRLFCFGRWFADYGNPIDWHLNPLNKERWNPQRNWTQVLRDEGRVGDVKLTWEVGRFPQAYFLSRAAAHEPSVSEAYAQTLFNQMKDFTKANPFGLGVHWSSGQEISIRLLAWLFAHRVLLSRHSVAEEATAFLERSIFEGATHIERHIGYAQKAVYNNHLLSEALALYVAGILFPTSESGQKWRKLGRDIFEAEVDHQFYQDGAYIQLSHNYHRVAMHYLMLATLYARASGDAPYPGWTKALERSLDFLVAHQNPDDGRLPNYGANDGALHAIFSTADFSDVRPVLQAASLLTRGERIYPPGPWDETSAWLIGSWALETPLRQQHRRSVSFRDSGFHVLRSHEENTFCTFRCGSVRDRFSQIDMLHVDVFWRGHNVLSDGGSYLYNGPQEWHQHFYRTESHNTLMVDGLDQMVHFRRFKNLYWTHARLLGFEETAHGLIVSGEHEGFARQTGGCIHRRSVLQASANLWVVADTVFGTGPHSMRLHWLSGDFPHAFDAPGGFTLATPSGPFSLQTFDVSAMPLSGDLKSGQAKPPRGWLSRYYGEVTPVASLAVEQTAELPWSALTVFGEGPVTLQREGELFVAQSPSSQVSFRLLHGLLQLSTA